MWLKPPLWKDHVCSKPDVPGYWSSGPYDEYKDCIWRCDDCLRVYICKMIMHESGRYMLVWKSYNFETGPN